MAGEALILIDIQYDFVEGGALEVPEGSRVVPVANHLMTKFELVLASQDWHPPDHESFAEQHPGHDVFETIEWKGLEQVLWPVHCVQGTRGAALVDELNTGRIERVFQKGTDRDIDSYSCFFDNGHEQATGMGDFLKQRGVRRVYLMGLATDVCVKFSALDARRLGLETYLIKDGCRGVDLRPGDVDRAIEEMKAAGVTVINSERLL